MLSPGLRSSIEAWPRISVIYIAGVSQLLCNIFVYLSVSQIIINKIALIIRNIKQFFL